MRYHYATVNTGHISHHDTDVDLYPTVIPELCRLLAAGSGPIPGVICDLRYTVLMGPGPYGLDVCLSAGPTMQHLV